MRESLYHEEFFVVFEMAASVASSFNFFKFFSYDQNIRY